MSTVHAQDASSKASSGPKAKVRAVLEQIRNRYVFYRTTVGHDLVLVRLPPSIRTTLTELTESVNAKALSARDLSLAPEDVVMILLLGLLIPSSCASLYLIWFKTNVGYATLEIYVTFLRPLAIAFDYLETERHDKIPVMLTYFVVLAFLLLVEPFGIKSYFPSSYVPVKCVLSYGFVHPTRGYGVLLYNYLERKLTKEGIMEGQGMKKRVELMHAHNEALDKATKVEKVGGQEEDETSADVGKEEEEETEAAPEKEKSRSIPALEPEAEEYEGQKPFPTERYDELPSWRQGTQWTNDDVAHLVDNKGPKPNKEEAEEEEPLTEEDVQTKVAEIAQAVGDIVGELEEKVHEITEGDSVAAKAKEKEPIIKPEEIKEVLDATEAAVKEAEAVMEAPAEEVAARVEGKMDTPSPVGEEQDKAQPPMETTEEEGKATTIVEGADAEGAAPPREKVGDHSKEEEEEGKQTPASVLSDSDFSLLSHSDAVEHGDKEDAKAKPDNKSSEAANASPLAKTEATGHDTVVAVAPDKQEEKEEEGEGDEVLVNKEEGKVDSSEEIVKTEPKKEGVEGAAVAAPPASEGTGPKADAATAKEQQGAASSSGETKPEGCVDEEKDQRPNEAAMPKSDIDAPVTVVPSDNAVASAAAKGAVSTEEVAAKAEVSETKGGSSAKETTADDTATAPS